MNTPADPQINERKFRFKDEWLVALVGTMPGITPELIKRWRFQQKPYVAQALIDGDVLSFKEIAELVKEAFRIDYVDLNPTEIDKNAMQLLPEKLCRDHNVLPVKVDSKTVWLAMANPLDQEAIQRVSWATSREVTPLFCPPGVLDKLVSETLRPDAMIYGLIEKLDQAVRRRADQGAGAGRGGDGSRARAGHQAGGCDHRQRDQAPRLRHPH